MQVIDNLSSESKISCMSERKINEIKINLRTLLS